MAKVRFKDLGIGERFVFATEHDPEWWKWSGLAKGPWIKRTARGYDHVDGRYGRNKVGTVNVEVVRD